MTGPAPHVCDESCACPVHGTRLLYSPAGGEHACQEPDCVSAHGMRRRWPPRLEGACFTREDGWHRLVRQPEGKIRREPIPAGEVREAGLPERPEMPDWQRMLVLQSEPLRNLIPRLA